MKIIIHIETNADGNVELAVHNEGHPASAWEMRDSVLLRTCILAGFNLIQAREANSERVDTAFPVSDEAFEAIRAAARERFAAREREREGGRR